MSDSDGPLVSKSETSRDTASPSLEARDSTPPPQSESASTPILASQHLRGIFGALKMSASFPMQANMSTFHVGVRPGQLAPRLLCMGSDRRARLVASLLDNGKFSQHTSSRGFVSYTGKYMGNDVSLMSIGMGLAMMDFMVREVRAMSRSPLLVVRLGTCGTPARDVTLGSVVCASSSRLVVHNPDAWTHGPGTDTHSATAPYRLACAVPADPALHAALVGALRKRYTGKDSGSVVDATDITAPFFYCTQGRPETDFDDRNTGLIDQLLRDEPEAGSIQMEAFQLLHLAQRAKPYEYYGKSYHSVRAASCAIVLAQRQTDAMFDMSCLPDLELAAGRACLDALVATPRWEVQA